jgi:glyoxylase-like metal-dependent hydrolase (beta-lactamase superfamily II)
VLFNGSFGRVDLPGGDLETLKNSIFNVMFKLPDETLVYCGHGSETTIGKEKRSNYILQF